MAAPIEIRTRDRWSFSCGGFVSGVIGNAHYFVLIFYSQLLGLDPGLAGLALSIGLVIDAVSDPLVGYLSDSTKSRWGRRHPYLYAAVLPLAASYYMLWHPPEFVVEGEHLFAYLMLCVITLRFSVTLYSVPAYAMVAEMTSDYQERTRMLSGIYAVNSVVGNGMSVLMYAIWLVPTETVTDGVMNLEGYQEAGIFGSLVIAVALIAFSLGMRRFIPRSKSFEADTPPSPGEFVAQIVATLRVKTVRIVIGASILYAAGAGAYAALWVYIYSYFWEFTSAQVSIIVIPMAVAGIFLPQFMARLTEGREKRQVAVFGLLSASLVNVLPIGLRLLGFFPENGTDSLFYIMIVLGFFETILFLVFDVALQSMTSDLTEQVQLDTNRRNEGIIAAGMTFAGKCASALGVMIAGFMLTLIAFPTETAVGEVDGTTLYQLGLVYGPMILVIWLGATYVASRYGLTHAQHEEAVAELKI